MFFLKCLPFSSCFSPSHSEQPAGRAMQGYTIHIQSTVTPETKNIWQRFKKWIFSWRKTKPSTEKFRKWPLPSDLKRATSHSDLSTRKSRELKKSPLPSDLKSLLPPLLKRTTSAVDLSIRNKRKQDGSSRYIEEENDDHTLNKIDFKTIVFNKKIKKNNALSFHFLLALKENKDKTIYKYKDESFIIRKAYTHSSPLFSKELEVYNKFSEYYPGGHFYLPTLLAHLEFKNELYLAIESTDSQTVQKFIFSPLATKEAILDILTQFLEMRQTIQKASVYVSRANLEHLVIKVNPRNNKLILTLTHFDKAHIQMPDTPEEQVREWKEEERTWANSIIFYFLHTIRRRHRTLSQECREFKEALSPSTTEFLKTVYPSIEKFKEALIPKVKKFKKHEKTIKDLEEFIKDLFPSIEEFEKALSSRSTQELDKVAHNLRKLKARWFRKKNMAIQ